MNYALNHFYQNNMQHTYNEYMNGNYLCIPAYYMYYINPYIYYGRLYNANYMNYNDNSQMSIPIDLQNNELNEYILSSIHNEINNETNDETNDETNHKIEEKYLLIRKEYIDLVKKYVDNIDLMNETVSKLFMKMDYYNNLIERDDNQIQTKEFAKCECSICYTNKDIYYMTPCCGKVSMCNDCIKDYLKTLEPLCDCEKDECNNKNYIEVSCPFCKGIIKNFIQNTNNLTKVD